MLSQIKKDLSAFQLLSFRSYFMLWISAISLCLFKVNIFSEKTIQRDKIVPLVTRTIFAIISMTLVIYSVKFINISEVYSVYYVYPGIVIVFVFVFLKEKVGPFDIICLISCFAGVILIVKPDFIFQKSGKSSESLFFSLVFIAAVLKAFEDVLVRNLGKEVHFLMVPIFYSTIGILLFPIPMILFDSVYPTFTIFQVFMIFIIGLCTFIYQAFMALGLQMENAGRVSMVNYLQVALMYITDLLIFHKKFNYLDLVGTCLIFGFNLSNGIIKVVKRINNLNKFKEKR